MGLSADGNYPTRHEELQMRHVKTLGVALIAMLALGLTAMSAFATLPDLSIQLGGAYPIHMQFNDNGTTSVRLNDTGGDQTTYKGLLLLLLASELSALGAFGELVLNVKMATKRCEQTGEKNKEEVLIKGTYHLVYPSLTPLTLGLALSMEPVAYNCEKVKIKVQGCALAQITDPLTAAVDVELMTTTLLGDGKGKNILTKYDNAAGTGTVNCILETNFGIEFLQAEESVEESIHLSTLQNKMFSIGPI
jgi:hypothetical protein